MSFETLRDKIVTTLNTVVGIGVVADHTEHSTTWEQHFDDHKKDGRINFWEVTRREASQDIRAVQNASSTEPFFFDRHQFVMTGRFALAEKGDTETAFQNLVSLVVDKFRVTNTLGGLTILPRQAQVEQVTHETWAGILVHRADILFEAVEAVGG